MRLMPNKRMKQSRAVASAMRTGGLTLAALACAHDAGFEPISPCTDSQIVDVHVDISAAPRFTWTPACGMASLQVFADTGGTPGWIVFAGAHAAENPLPSGIRYGEVPPDGIAPAGVAPLVRGVRYDVVVYRWVGAAAGPGSLFQRGSTSFVR